MEIISIITPSFNQGQFIEDAIQSVLRQSGDFYIDYIILDGGSNDSSVDVIRKYERLLQDNCGIQKHGDLHFYEKGTPDFPFCKCRGISYRWLSEKDNGQASAINRGISMTKGEYFAWINSDDYYLGAETFRRAIDFFRAHPEAGMIYGRGFCVDSDKHVTRDYHDNCTTLSFDRDILKYECFLFQASVFIRSSVVRDTGPLDESLNWCLDWDYWLRIGEKHDVVFFPYWAACFRQYEGIKTLQYSGEMFSERYRVMRKHSGFWEYIVNRWYHQASMKYYRALGTNQLRYIVSKRYRRTVSKIVAYGIELGIHYSLRLLRRLVPHGRRGQRKGRVAIFIPRSTSSNEITPRGAGLANELIERLPGVFMDVFIDDDARPSGIDRPSVRIMRHTMFYRCHHVYDAVLYVIEGAAHGIFFMLPYIRRYGGIVDLRAADIDDLYPYLADAVKRKWKERDFIRAVQWCVGYRVLKYIIWDDLIMSFFRGGRNASGGNLGTSFLAKKARIIIAGGDAQAARWRLPRGKCRVADGSGEGRIERIILS